MNTLQVAEYVSSLVLKLEYRQILVKEVDKDQTAFIISGSLYQFNVMSFSLCNTPATFERMIDSVLGEFKWCTCLCFVDDIIISSRTLYEHLGCVLKF